MYDIKIKSRVISYAPSLFQKLREMDDLLEAELIQSLMPSKNRDSIFKINKKSSVDTNDGGRSGSFFFFT